MTDHDPKVYEVILSNIFNRVLTDKWDNLHTSWVKAIKTILKDMPIEKIITLPWQDDEQQEFYLGAEKFLAVKEYQACFQSNALANDVLLLD